MSVMPTDLSMWDINPKSGVGLPLTVTVVGYLIIPGYGDYGQNSPTPTPVDGQTVHFQIDWGGGNFHNTLLSMVTGYNPSTGYHGYFSGTVALTVEGGNGIWVYAPGTYYFRMYYAGNSSLGAATSPIISVTDAYPTTDLSMWDINPKSGEGAFACTVVGYLMMGGSNSSIVDGETVILEIQNPDGSWTDTGVHMTTGYNSDTGYHGYYSGTAIIGTKVSTAPYGPGSSYMPWPQGAYNFRVSYAGNSSKNLVGC